MAEEEPHQRRRQLGTQHSALGSLSPASPVGGGVAAVPQQLKMSEEETLAGKVVHQKLLSQQNRQKR